MQRSAFHRLAERELNEAAQYYELESAGLGLAVLEEIERHIQPIVDHSETGAILHGGVRRYVVRAVAMWPALRDHFHGPGLSRDSSTSW